MKIKINNIIQSIFIILYKVLLDIVYVKGVIPVYKYQGFADSFSLKCFIISYLLIIFVIIVVNKLLDDCKFSNLVIVLLFMLYYIPMTTIFAFTENDLKFMLLVTLYFVFLLVFNQIIKIKLPNVKIGFKKIDWLILITIFLSIMMVVVSGVYSRFKISFNLSEYYELRFSARELTMPTIIRYLFNWARYIIPIGMVYTLIKKKTGLAIFLSFAQMLSFSFNGKKSSLFLFFLAFIIAFFFKEKYWRKIPLIFSGLGIVSLSELLFRDGVAATVKYLIRRAMMIPAHLGWVYYDFFSKHEPDYLRSSTLRHLGLNSPYTSIPRMIGNLYSSASSLGENNANTGLFGDAFANFGLIGIILYPLLIIIAIKVLEDCLKDLDPRICAITCITVAYMFLNGAFFKIMLTNGYIIICLLFLFNKTNLIQKEQT